LKIAVSTFCLEIVGRFLALSVAMTYLMFPHITP